MTAVQRLAQYHRDRAIYAAKRIALLRGFNPAECARQMEALRHHNGLRHRLMKG